MAVSAAAVAVYRVWSEPRREPWVIFYPISLSYHTYAIVVVIEDKLRRQVRGPF